VLIAMTSPATALRPGDKLASTVCTTKVVVIRAPADRRPLIACGGSPMVPAADAPQPPGETPSVTAAGTSIGKRYVDETETIELLCTATGTGELSCEGAPMNLKAAKPLPASD
jgi:hypothetical protein